jgi:hypothetical protein
LRVALAAEKQRPCALNPPSTAFAPAFKGRPKGRPFFLVFGDKAVESLDGSVEISARNILLLQVKAGIWKKISSSLYF